MTDKIKLATIVLLALLLCGCATGNELKGTWTLMIGRDGTCRTVEHQADTDQLSTSTRWRGEGCGGQMPSDSATTALDLDMTAFDAGEEPVESIDQGDAATLDLSKDGGKVP